MTVTTCFVENLRLFDINKYTANLLLLKIISTEISLSRMS